MADTSLLAPVSNGVSLPLPVPALSVILVTPDVYATVAITMAYLRAQTVQDQIELILVAPTRQELAQPEGAFEGFATVKIVESGWGEMICEAKSLAVGSATTPVVAFTEDHCFPESDWAEKMIAAHARPYAAVGPRFSNGNPRTGLSWADYLLNFGAWSEPGESHETTNLPWHNTSYKREILTNYGEQLGSLLAVEGLLMEDLKARGETLYLETGARVQHLNVSLPGAFIGGFFHAGRLFGSLRSRSWHPLRRVGYSLAAPLIPLTRMRGQFSHLYRHRAAEAIPRRALRRLAPLMLLGSIIHIVGEIVGILFGVGDALRHKNNAESHRTVHLCRADLRDLAQRAKKVSGDKRAVPAP